MPRTRGAPTVSPYLVPALVPIRARDSFPGGRETVNLGAGLLKRGRAATMIVYGLLGFTHNGGRTLTVMSPEGALTALGEIAAGDGVVTQAGPGQLTHYQEKRRGALQDLIAAHGIQVLDKPAWAAKKAELGPVILD